MLSELLQHLPIIIGFLTQFAGVVWKLGRMEAAINANIAKVEHENNIELLNIKQEILKSQLEASNIYLKRESFRTFISTIDSRLIHLEEKLDKILSVHKQHE